MQNESEKKKTFENLGPDQKFLDLTQKVWSIKGKIDTLNLITVKTIVMWKLC
jgi:hypothetical protein